MPDRSSAFLEHVAFHVRDIGWHIAFFEAVLGMSVREAEGDPSSPLQAWTIGGLQLVADPGFEGPEGRFAHLGIMCDDVETAIAAGLAYPGVTEHAKGRNWLLLPDGLLVELLQAAPGSVAAALSVKARG